MDHDLTIPLFPFLLTFSGWIFLFFLEIGGICCAWYLFAPKKNLSPYCGKPLVPARLLSFSAMEKLSSFLLHLSDEEFYSVDIDRAAICPETGRIFPNAINRWGSIRISRKFLKKYYSGTLVQWNSLSDQEKKIIQSMHFSLSHFSTSPHASALHHKPGPLYADREKKILLGWKRIPGTSLEALVLQIPNKKKYDQFFKQEKKNSHYFCSSLC